MGGKLEGMWDMRNHVGSSVPGSGAECYVPPKRKARLGVPGAEFKRHKLNWSLDEI